MFLENVGFCNNDKNEEFRNGRLKYLDWIKTVTYEEDGAAGWQSEGPKRSYGWGLPTSHSCGLKVLLLLLSL